MTNISALSDLTSNSFCILSPFGIIAYRCRIRHLQLRSKVRPTNNLNIDTITTISLNIFLLNNYIFILLDTTEKSREI